MNERVDERVNKPLLILLGWFLSIVKTVVVAVKKQPKATIISIGCHAKTLFVADVVHVGVPFE